MKRTLHILLLAMLGCMSLLSCGKLIYEEGGDCDESVMHVSLRVSAGGSAASRALTETDEPGTGCENFIDVKKLHILFFDKDNNKFLQSFKPEQVSPTGNSEYPDEWVLRGTIQNPPKTGFKIVALANWPSDSLANWPSEYLEVEKTTIEDVCNADWAMGEYKAPFTPSKDTPIPMYGVLTTEDEITFDPKVEAYLGQIDLLRAFAKITVCLSKGSTVQLDSVTLSNYNKRFACAPPLGMYGNTVNSELNSALHLANNSDPADGPLDFAPSTDKKSWTIYVPEYLNADKDGKARKDCSYIELKVNGIDRPYRIDFRDYGENGNNPDDGQRFNIVRNFEYRYEVTITPILFTVTVEKWTSVKVPIELDGVGY